MKTNAERLRALGFINVAPGGWSNPKTGGTIHERKYRDYRYDELGRPCYGEPTKLYKTYFYTERSTITRFPNMQKLIKWVELLYGSRP